METSKLAETKNYSETRLLSEESAIHNILEKITPILDEEIVPLNKARNRILARDIIAPINVPSECNSAMDGYAICLSNTPSEKMASFKIIGQAFAGHPFEREIKQGEAVKVMTGGIIPKGANCVIQQEWVSESNGHIFLTKNGTENLNIRNVGEDIQKGMVILEKGRKIAPADIGLAASVGIKEISTIRRPLIGVLSTGDELKQPGEICHSGEIYDSNRPLLIALLQNADVDTLDLGHVHDHPQSIRETLITASDKVDMLITTGGASVGEADHMHSLLLEHGTIEFWKIAIKPGKPLIFGKLQSAVFFGLPGNPVSAMVTFGLFVRPALDVLRGTHYKRYSLLKAFSIDALKKKPGRTDFQRGFFKSKEGTLVVASTGMQGSHMLRSMSEANCLIRLPQNAGNIAAGETVDIIPFNELF